MEHASLITSQPEELSDDTLIQLVTTGNQQAFELLVRWYQPILVFFICQLIHDRDLTEEVLQRAWMQLYLAAHRLHTYLSLKGWLCRVARNRCYDLLRRKHLLYMSELEGGVSEGEPGACGPLLDPALLPEEFVEQQEVRQYLFHTIQALPVKQRAVVWLRYAEQLSYAELGHRLHLSISTARITFHRVKQVLRQELLNGCNRREKRAYTLAKYARRDLILPHLEGQRWMNPSCSC